MYKIFISIILLLVCSISSPAGVGAGDIPMLEKRLNAYPSNLKLRYVLSRAYAAKGRQDPRYYRKSVKQLEEIMSVKQIPVVKFFLGLVHARQNDLDTAIYHWLTIARSMKPNNLTTLRYLALAYSKKRKFSDSLKYWNKILKINPEDYKAHYFAGVTTLRNRSLKEKLRIYNAAKHFAKVVKKYPKHVKSLKKLNFCFKNSKQYLKQRKILQRLAMIMPGDQDLRKEIVANKKNVAANPDSPDAEGFKPTEEELQQQVQPDTGIPDGGIKSNELDDSDFNKVFGNDPEPTEAPEDTQPAQVDVEPTLQPGSILSADAELLFNQGMTYLSNREYDLALFNFLQAQEMDPKFAQCYLQIGEVYLKLTDSTPSEDKFKEHLRLARQSLETAKQLEPDSLLAHAANAKMVQIDKKASQGFVAAHMEVAAQAVENGDYRFAVEEYLILLSNNFHSIDLIFSIYDIMGHLDEGSKLELQHVIVQLVTNNTNAQLLYLKGRFEPEMDQDAAWKSYEAIFKLKDGFRSFFVKLKERFDLGKSDFVDAFLIGRYSLSQNANGAAREHFKKALEMTTDGAMKKKVEHWLGKTKEVKSSLPPLVGITSGAKGLFAIDDYKEYRTEKIAVNNSGADFSGFFANPSSISFVREKLEVLENYTISSPDNILARYILANIWSQSQLADIQARAEQELNHIHGINNKSAGWYLEMGLLAFQMNDTRSSELFFKKSSAAKLKEGWESYEPFASKIASMASKNIDENKLEKAGVLIKTAETFNPLSLTVAGQKARFLDASGVGSFSWSSEFFGQLMGSEEFFGVFLGDLGLVAFWALLLTLLTFSLAMVIKYSEQLKHIFDELVGRRSLSIPIITFVIGILLVFFPTGLVIFLPVVLWGFLDDFEQIMFGILIGVMLILPFILPVGYVNNSKHIRALHLLKEGELVEARKIYSTRAKENPMDLDAKFQLALIDMNSGTAGLNPTRAKFEAILAEKPAMLEALGNVAVCYARQGKYGKAIDYLTKALHENPFHDKVLYNLSKCYELKGELKHASKYLQWIGGSGDEASKKNIERYLAISGSVPVFAPFYLKGAVYHHNTFFAPVYQSAMSTNMFLFIIWFFMGGGLVGVLFFMKDKMDIVAGKCSVCEASICNQCQSVLNGKVLCSECFDSEERRQKGVFHFRKERHAGLMNISQIMNFILPGAGQFAASKIVLGCILSMGFWFGFIYWLTDFGYLWNQILYFGSSFTSTLVLILFLAAIGFYVVSNVMTFLSKSAAK
jgi:tetratricopeptide (TPR) repeat protein